MVRRKTVLIVEDEVTNQAIFEAIVDMVGADSAVATDGTQGLAQAQRLHPSLIVLDLVLPALSGCDVLRALKADPATWDIPVLAITALPEKLCEAALAAGADECLDKPFDVERLIDRIGLYLTSTPPVPGEDAAGDHYCG